MALIALMKRALGPSSDRKRQGVAATRRIVIDRALPTDLFIEPDTDTMLHYSLWTRRPGEEWYEIGPERTDNNKVHHWMFVPPDAAPREFAYSLGVWGCTNDYWRVYIGVRQRDCNSVADGWTVRGAWTDTGMLDINGVGIHISSLAAASRSVLIGSETPAQKEVTVLAHVLADRLSETDQGAFSCNGNTP
jgi:hypothetical protein